LAMLGLALGFLGAAETRLLEPYARAFPPGSEALELALWHGVEPALLLSALSLAAGLALFAARRAGERWRLVPARFEADRLYYAGMQQLDRVAIEVTGATQRGSLPIYLSSVLVVVVVLSGGALLLAMPWRLDLRLWDTPAQAMVAAVVAAAAILAARARRRLKAVVLVGVTGYGTALLFLRHGAPGLGLIQVLVDAVTIVVFV